MTTTASLWKQFFPAIELPESQLRIWMALHTTEIVESGIAQLAVKNRKLGGEMNFDYMVKFASAVMNRMAREATNKVMGVQVTPAYPSHQAGVEGSAEDNRGNR